MPQTMKESARLKTGHTRRSIKSITPWKNTLSKRFPDIPPAIIPRKMDATAGKVFPFVWKKKKIIARAMNEAIIKIERYLGFPRSPKQIPGFLIWVK